MDWRAQCATVIPCLNEELKIGQVVTGVLAHVSTVLVVDDGSVDRTAQVAQSHGALVLRHDRPRGKGRALTTGWKWCSDHQFLWVVTLDGDGQHSPDDIPLFFHAAEECQTSLVVGNRMADTLKMPPLRRFVNRWMSARLSSATGQPLQDTQCGFRLMNLAQWANLPIRAQHYEIESEVLLAFASAGLRIRFVPIRVIYEDERSKINPLRDTLRWWRWWRQAKHFYGLTADTTTLAPK